MNLEQLQAMSDEELNELAAIKFLWGGIVNVPSDNWNPTTDMNDAMELVNKMDVCMGFNYVNGKASVQFISGNEEDGFVFLSQVLDQPPARAITIASILAKKS